MTEERSLLLPENSGLGKEGLNQVVETEMKRARDVGNILSLRRSSSSRLIEFKDTRFNVGVEGLRAAHL